MNTMMATDVKIFQSLEKYLFNIRIENYLDWWSVVCRPKVAESDWDRVINNTLLNLQSELKCCKKV